MNWFDCLQAYEKIAETHSFVGAARELQLPNSVVTKRIQWLEAELQSTLLVRTTRSVTLTDAGEHLLKKIKPLLAEWHDIRLQLVDYQSQPRGEIKLRLAPGLIGLSIMMDAIKNFSAAHPYLHLNITTTHEPVRIADTNIDVLIAIEKYILDPGETVGIKLFKFNYKCYAAPSFILTHGEPKNPAELVNYNCLVYNNDSLWEYSGKKIAVAGNFHADAGDALIAASIAGLGLIYIPDFIAKYAVDNKKLKPLLNAYPGKQDQLMLFYANHEYMPRKIELLIKSLRMALKN
jgi:LysR family transcriptional regulator for bpeEF and oprC